MKRRALVTRRWGTTKATIERYLPANYEVTNEDADYIEIQGEDFAGWTLDGYVIPRLASGLHFAEEVST